MRVNDAYRSLAPAYVVMGVSGVGKTTIAKAISQKQECLCLEGDDFHSPENIKVMSSGQTLTDQNRLPWLRELSSHAALKRQKECVVMACSALKLSCRDEIRKHVPDVRFIHLQGDFDFISELVTFLARPMGPIKRNSA